LYEPELVQAFSTDKAVTERVARETWDAIYIDGNHDYETARADWDLCAAHLAPGGIIVLDDSAMETDYRPPAFATAGHPGPSQVAREVDNTGFREVLRVGHNRVFQKQ
jgi:predicted O-methyltransferase YrrM